MFKFHETKEEEREYKVVMLNFGTSSYVSSPKIVVGYKKDGENRLYYKEFFHDEFDKVLFDLGNDEKPKIWIKYQVKNNDWTVIDKCLHLPEDYTNY